MNFSTSILGAKPLLGHDFSNFLIQKKCPLYGHCTGVEKIFIRHFQVCEHIELEVCNVFGTSPSVWNFTKCLELHQEHRKKWTFQSRFWMQNPFGVKISKNFHFQKTPPIILSWLAKKNWYLNVRYVMTVMWLSPYIIDTQIVLKYQITYIWLMSHP